MARLILSREAITNALRRELMSRARLTLQVYRKQPLERDRSSYPFARHAEDGSIRSPSSSTVRPTARGVRITVQSRGAPYIEDGNKDGKAYIKAGPGGSLVIPLRRKTKGGRVFMGEDGRPYLAVQRVRTYRGQRLLEISAREAFGTRQIRRPSLH